jgi:hypothetical protein
MTEAETALRDALAALHEAEARFDAARVVAREARALVERERRTRAEAATKARREQ